MRPFKKGDRVRVREEYRAKFNAPAGDGEILTVSGPNLGAVGIGPLTLDYAYHWELELVEDGPA